MSMGANTPFTLAQLRCKNHRNWSWPTFCGFAGPVYTHNFANRTCAHGNDIHDCVIIFTIINIITVSEYNKTSLVSFLLLLMELRQNV